MTFFTQKHRFVSPGVSTGCRHGPLLPPNRREPLCFVVHVHVSMKAPSHYRVFTPMHWFPCLFPGSSEVPKTGLESWTMRLTCWINQINAVGVFSHQEAGEESPSGWPPRTDLDHELVHSQSSRSIPGTTKTRLQCFQVTLKCTETYWWRRRWKTTYFGQKHFLFFPFLQDSAPLHNACMLWPFLESLPLCQRPAHLRDQHSRGTQSLFPGGLITSATHHRGHYAKGSHPFRRGLSISWFCVLPHISSCLWIPFPAISPICLDFSTIAYFSLNAILHLSALPIEHSTAF